MKSDQDLARYDLQVMLTLASEAVKGLSRPLFSGDRAPHVYFDGYEWMASFHLEDCYLLHPGETGLARVQLVIPRKLAEQLQVGVGLQVRYLGWTIGEAVIMSMNGPMELAPAARNRKSFFDGTAPVPWHASIKDGEEHPRKWRRGSAKEDRRDN